MTLEELSYLAQIGGVLAVVITLVCLSVQVRQGTELLRSESRQAQFANDQNGVYMLVNHPELGRSFSQKDTPDFIAKTRLQFWLVGQMRAREHEWLQFQSGALDESTWLRWSRTCRMWISGSGWMLLVSDTGPDGVRS